jgi:hypothetical protein
MSDDHVGNFGYGQHPRCSPLQQQWQTSHPTFLAIQQRRTVKDYLSNAAPLSLLGDPSVLVPSSTPSLWSKTVQLRDYVQLPLHLWVPDFFLPHLVPFMPCPEKRCKARTTRRRWHSGGPRVIHGVHSAVYLHCWEYVCTSHHQQSFNGWDDRSLNKLPAAARSHFKFVLTREEGVTLELHSRIVHARVSKSSFHALRRELMSNRYERMYQMIALYYQDCERHKLDITCGIQYYFPGRGAVTEYDAMPPVLSDRAAYFDYESPSIPS